VDVKLNDRVFEHEMRRAVKLADDAYSRMLYKDALKVGFFQLQTVLNKYRELCGSDGMNLALVNKFIDVQTLLLCPICPHIAEEIWEITGKKSFAVNTLFPEIQEYDPILIESSEYLADTVR
jgi:leucyl-tRNA synthetase